VDVDLHTSPDAADFARLCTHLEFIELREYAGGERWSIDGSREKLALKFYLSKAIALHTPNESKLPEHYVKFAQSLNPNDVVVTFNWDLLLEKAIECAGLKYCYNYQQGKIHLLKLHGSINWINNAPRSMGNNRLSFNYQPLGYKEGLMENEVYCSNKLTSKIIWQDARALVDEVKPKIILPGYGKAFDIRELSVLWYRIEFLNLRQRGVSIIGLNVSQDDFIVESLFRYLLRSVISDETPVHVVNPDPDVGDRFKQMAGARSVKFHNEKFTAETLDLALLT